MYEWMQIFIHCWGMSAKIWDPTLGTGKVALLVDAQPTRPMSRSFFLLLAAFMTFFRPNFSIFDRGNTVQRKEQHFQRVMIVSSLLVTLCSRMCGLLHLLRAIFGEVISGFSHVLLQGLVLITIHWFKYVLVG